MLSLLFYWATLARLVSSATVSYNYDLANATLAVVIDEHFHSDGKDKTGDLRAYLGAASVDLLAHGGLNVEFYGIADFNLRPELTAVLTIASCEDTWRIFKLMQNDALLQFSITDADCPRLPRNAGFTVPLTERGGDLPQMILDMKVQRVLAWKSAVVLHDSSVDAVLMDRLLAALSADTVDIMPSTVSAFSIAVEQTDWKRRKRVENVLRALPLAQLGQKFMVLVSSDLVGVVMDVAKSLGLVHPQSQWLYILGDTTAGMDSLSTYTSLLTEGDNVAFASNYTTRLRDQQHCEGGLMCHAKELLRAFLAALDRSVQEEQDMATQVSDEEWEAIRPSKEDRMALLLSLVRELLRSTGTCGNCTAWRLRAGDTWGLTYEEEDPSKAWTPPPPTDTRPQSASLKERLMDRLNALRSKKGPRRSSRPRPQGPVVWPEEELDAESIGPVSAEQQEQPPRRRPRSPRWSSQQNAVDEDYPDLAPRAPPRHYHSHQQKARLVPVGWWRPREGLALEDSLFPHAAHGFRGRTLPLVSFHNPPWQIIVSNATGHVIEYKGLIFEIVNELAQNLNFTYSVHFPKLNSVELTKNTDIYTSKTEGIDLNNAFSLNVSWDKLVQTVLENKVFLGAAAFTVTSERKQLVNYTRTISKQPYHFMVVRPRELSRAMLFTSPFTATTWLSIALSVAGIGPILNWIHRASPFYEYRGEVGHKGGLNSMTNCLWYAYGALLQQGGSYLPDADSGRLVVGTWWLVVLVLVTTYCGNLVAALTFPRLETSISSTQDLLEQSDQLSWGVPRWSPLIEHLKGSDLPRLTPVLKNALVHDDQEDVLERVRSGTHVYIDWQVNLLQLMKRDFNSNGRCDFTVVSVHDFVEEQVAMIMSRENPYLGVINDELKRMQQVGLIQKWLEDYLPKKDKCWTSSSLQANNHSVNLGDMQGSFFVLFFGFLLAGVLILIECSWRRWHTSKDKKVIKPFVS